jgi:hypothetical protein
LPISKRKRFIRTLIQILFLLILFWPLANMFLDADYYDEEKLDWPHIIGAYDHFIESPSDETLKQFLITLPPPSELDKEYNIYSTGDEIKYILRHDNFPVLRAEMMAGNKYATEAMFRLLNLSDGGPMTTIMIILGDLIRVNPRLFLETLMKYKDTLAIKRLGYPVYVVGPAYADRPEARHYELEMRKESLEAVREKEYENIQKECIKLLKDRINVPLGDG